MGIRDKFHGQFSLAQNDWATHVSGKCIVRLSMHTSRNSLPTYGSSFSSIHRFDCNSLQWVYIACKQSSLTVTRQWKLQWKLMLASCMFFIQLCIPRFLVVHTFYPSVLHFLPAIIYRRSEGWMLSMVWNLHTSFISYYLSCVCNILPEVIYLFIIHSIVCKAHMVIYIRQLGQLLNNFTGPEIF